MRGISSVRRRLAAHRCVGGSHRISSRLCESLESRRLLTGTIGTPLVFPPVTGAEGYVINQDVAAFSDSVPNPIASYNAQIDWGDSSPAQPGVVTFHTGDGFYYVAGSHQYIKPGVFSIKVTLNDGPIGGLLTSSATSTGGPVTITPINDPPIASGENLGTMFEDSGPHTFSFGGLLANDLPGPVGESDEDPQTLTITALSNIQGGSATINGTNVIFTPTADFSGPGQFTYTIRDNGLDGTTSAPRTATATATFTIAEVNDAPTARGDFLNSMPEDSATLTIDKALLLTNDSAGPANEASQTLSISAVSNAVGGTVTLVSGSPRFTPDPNFNGLAGFTYTLSDNGTTNGSAAPLTDSATVSFLVTPVNDAPIAADDALPANHGSAPRTIAFAELLGNDQTGPANESGQTLTIVGVSNPTGGTVAINGNTIVFTPTAGFDGTARFTYTASDNGATGTIADPKTAQAQVSFDVVLAPAIVSANYLFDASQPIVVATATPNTTLSTGAAAIFQDSAGTSTKVAGISVSTVPGTSTFFISYTGAPNGALPDGLYHLQLPANAVMNRLGETMPQPYRFDFFVLAGDANRDRAVDVSDLGVLATNWQSSSKLFSKGDFNYDGVVDVSDLGILATNWQKSVAASAPAVATELVASQSPFMPASASPTSAPARSSAHPLIADLELI
jgi:hypothetical protein